MTIFHRIHTVEYGCWLGNNSQQSLVCMIFAHASFTETLTCSVRKTRMPGGLLQNPVLAGIGPGADRVALAAGLRRAGTRERSLPQSQCSGDSEPRLTGRSTGNRGSAPLRHDRRPLSGL